MPSHQDDQDRLLDSIGRMGSAGRAEAEDEGRLRRTFWPVPEHLRAFDPDVVLVVGPRGAGKTELFRTVIGLDLLPDLAGYIPKIRLPPITSGQTSWIPGYPIRTAFPSPLQLREFLKQREPTDDLFLEIWLSYLVRVLGDHLDEKNLLSPILSPTGGAIGQVVGAFQKQIETALLALDRLDQRLTRDDRYVFIAYDELDTLARADAEIVRAAVRGLVALWATHTRRWRRIRGKIFLRTDLYQSASTAGGADLAKLSANRTELSWQDRDLYAMLVRRLANSDESLQEYCQEKVRFREDPKLGLFPIVKEASDLRPLIERIIGVYMGADARKGRTFRWLLDHVRDGKGQALPRPLVQLLEAAADIQKTSGTRPRWPRLIEPRSLRRALDKVSGEHVASALDEWPWLRGLQRRLSRLSQVPWDRREIERHLEKNWSGPWGDVEDARPPVRSAGELTDYLVDVGIFRSRPDHRLDVPDLFLAGLGLKRQGGVSKR